tara:strand:+ start:4902 stop:5567 length:666 start_codon:yes stop_codon:yes gene_type:complete
MDNTDLSDLLKKIDQRLDRIEKQLEPKKSLEAMPLPNEVNILVDTIDESFNPHTENGLKNLDKIESVKNLLNTLSQRETIESIDSLTKSMHKLAPLIEKLKDIEDVICILADSTDEIMFKATQSGVNFEDFSENLKRFSLEIIHLMESGALDQLLSSGILDKKSIEVVGTLGHSLAISHASKRNVGPFKIFAALFNKDIQRSIGFALNLATHFGRKLKNNK